MASFAILPSELLEKYSEVASLIEGSYRFLILSHLRPDGDATGSALGLARSLRIAGKVADIALCDPIPERFRFLIDDDVIITADQLRGDYDLIIVLDSGDLSRTGFEEALEGISALVVNLDHHASNTLFADINLLDEEASSTCEMITILLSRADLPLTSEVAEPLYLGLATDSRFFQNENLRPAAHLAAAQLLCTGLSTRRLLAHLNGSRSPAELRVLGLGLMKMKRELDGRLSSMILTREDLSACEATIEQVWSCGIFNQIVSVQGAVVGLGVVEGPDGKSYCEFRSRSGFDVKEVAVAMGGGGHLAASGGNRVAPVQDVAEEALQRLRDKLAQFSPDLQLSESCI